MIYEPINHATVNCVTCKKDLRIPKRGNIRTGHVHHPALGCNVLATFCGKNCHNFYCDKDTYLDRNRYCVGYIANWTPDMGLKEI